MGAHEIQHAATDTEMLVLGLLESLTQFVCALCWPRIHGGTVLPTLFLFRMYTFFVPLQGALGRVIVDVCELKGGDPPQSSALYAEELGGHLLRAPQHPERGMKASAAASMYSSTFDLDSVLGTNTYAKDLNARWLKFAEAFNCMPAVYHATCDPNVNDASTHNDINDAAIKFSLRFLRCAKQGNGPNRELASTTSSELSVQYLCWHWPGILPALLSRSAKRKTSERHSLSVRSKRGSNLWPGTKCVPRKSLVVASL